jgi:uncharacterized membrane protein YedE/YeeE
MPMNLGTILLFGAFGLAYGAVLQRSGFCFSRSGFELFLLHRREAVNGVLAGLLTATAGFAVVGALRARATDHLLLIPVGFGTAAGGLLFGLGMTLAGMCASGTLQRMGEGYASAWVALVGIILGAALDPFRAFLPRAWQVPIRGLWLGRTLGPIGGGLLTIAVLALLWAGLNGKLPGKRSRDDDAVTDLASPRVPPQVIGGVALGLLNTAQMAFVGPWTVGYPLSLIGPALSRTITWHALAAAAPLLVLDGGIVLGALFSCARYERLRWRRPRRLAPVVTAFAGGVCMGWGTQLARGCSIGGAFSAIPSLSLSGWIFLPALVLGAWAGTQVVRRVG